MEKLYSGTQSNFIADTKFFFTNFHFGTGNIIFHVISIATLFYGLVNKDIILSILGLAVIDELGHIYNYLFPHNRDPHYNPIRMLPYQILYVVPPGLILFKIFGLI